MIGRIAAGVVGVAVAVAPIPFLLLPLLVGHGAITNECIFDGGGEDCYGIGTRLAMGLWSFSGFAAAAAIAYIGAAGVYYALTKGILPRLRAVVVVGVILVFIALVPLTPFTTG